MKYKAVLITSRELERGVMKFAPDLVNAEGLSREFLRGNGCVEGDRFEIFELRDVPVKTVDWEPAKK